MTASIWRVFLFLGMLLTAGMLSISCILSFISWLYVMRACGVRSAMLFAPTPVFPRKGLGLQVLKMFSPLMALVPDSTRIVIVIDALDECNKNDNSREGGELIPLLMRTLRAASQRASLLITSRVEDSIRTMFDEITNGNPEQRVLRLHDIDESVVRGDLDRYFRYHLRRMALRDRTLCADEWPGDTVFEELLTRAGVLFVYAATVVRFLENRDFSPSMLLRRVLDRNSPSAPAAYRLLDLLYAHVLATAASVDGDIGPLEKDLVVRVRCLIGTIVCLQQPLNSKDIVALMNLDQYETQRTLAQLSAVLIFEDNEPVRIFHPSFPDFLVDPLRCLDERFRLHLPEQHLEMAFRCLAIMNKRLRYDMCGTGRPWLHNDEVVHLVDALEDLGSLRYACMYWGAHLCLAGAPGSRLVNELVSFSEQHLLHWFEFLSLINKVSCIDDYLPGVLGWCEASAQHRSLCMR
jgi:hypothetical protein